MFGLLLSCCITVAVQGACVRNFLELSIRIQGKKITHATESTNHTQSVWAPKDREHPQRQGVSHFSHEHTVPRALPFCSAATIRDHVALAAFPLFGTGFFLTTNV